MKTSSITKPTNRHLNPTSIQSRLKVCPNRDINIDHSGYSDANLESHDRYVGDSHTIWLAINLGSCLVKEATETKNEIKVLVIP